jgi:signal peptidase II
VRDRRMWVFGLVLPLLLGFDFATKRATVVSLPVGGEVQLIPGWLSWFHAENPYVAFSMPVPLPAIVAFGVLAVVGLSWTLWRLPRDARMQAAALATVLAGALGNLLDRVGDGSVTDMIRVYTTHPRLAPWLVERFGTATWPIFNVADVCVGAGVVLWLAHAATEREQPVAVP